MATYKQKVEIHIGRVSGGNPRFNGEDGYINIEVTDPHSHVQFLDIEMSFADFDKLVSSGSMQTVDAEIRNLGVVGKKRVREARSVVCPLEGFHDRQRYESWLKQNAQEEGWILDWYLGTQTSVVGLSGKEKGHRLNYSVHKFIERE